MEPHAYYKVTMAVNFVMLRWSCENDSHFKCGMTLPYKSITNGGVKRLNETTQNAIQKYMLDHSTKRFVDVLQSLIFSYNSGRKYSRVQIFPPHPRTRSNAWLSH